MVFEAVRFANETRCDDVVIPNKLITPLVLSIWADKNTGLDKRANWKVILAIPEASETTTDVDVSPSVAGDKFVVEDEVLVQRP